ncbi:hypothetical protein STEG23_021805 [Scotinomys teguina]
MTHLQAGLSPDTIEKARLELNENPDVLHQDIQQVRDMIITRPDIGFLRTDDAFILRFLRARKFHQADAFRLLAQYFQYRQLNLDMFKNFKADDPGIKRALIDGFPGVLENRDHYGRKILLLFAANWDQSSAGGELSTVGAAAESDLCLNDVIVVCLILSLSAENIFDFPVGVSKKQFDLICNFSVIDPKLS